MSKSGYYSHKLESISEKTEIENTVINCFKKHNRNYGRIRIRKELLNEGIDISEYRIAKILKKYGLVAKSGRTGKPKQPKPTEEQYIEENLIKDKFSVKEPNYLWCSDITVLNWLQTKDICMWGNRCGYKKVGRLGYSQASATGNRAKCI